MGVEKEAGVRVKLTGDDEVAAAAKKVSSAWGEVGSKATGAFKDMGGAVAGAVQGVLSDLGHVVSAAGAISFASSVAGVERFEDSVARLSVASGRSFGSVQSGVNELARDIAEMPEATEAWVHSVGGLTYSYERAAQSAKGLQGYAMQTGQSIQQVAPLAIVLDQIGAGGEKSGKALAVMTRQAEMLGTVGGPKALGDMLTHLSSQVTDLSSEGGTSKITALMAGFGGKSGLTPQQRERSLGGVMSRIEGNVEGFERHFGMKHGAFSDENGHVKDMTSILAMLQKEGKQSKGLQNRLEYTFGREATAAIMKTDFAAVRDAEKATERNAGGDALERFKKTPAGEKRDQDIRKDIEMQKDLGADSFLGQARRAVGDFAASHPLTTAFGGAVTGKLAASGAGALAKMLGMGGASAAAGGGGAAAAGGAEGMALAGGGTVAGAAALPLAAMIAQFAVLAQLGEGSAAKQGFSNRVIGGDEAATLAARAKKAEGDAAGNRSPGMQAALELEQARIAKAKAGRDPSGAPEGAKAGAGDAQMKAMVEQLMKAGAGLQLAQETAAKLITAGNQPITIEIVNPTGADIQARRRGKQ